MNVSEDHLELPGSVRSGFAHLPSYPQLRQDLQQAANGNYKRPFRFASLPT